MGVVAGSQGGAVDGPDGRSYDNIGQPFVFFEEAHDADVVSAAPAAAGKNKGAITIFCWHVSLLKCLQRITRIKRIIGMKSLGNLTQRWAETQRIFR
jgi:hypothetical protein